MRARTRRLRKSQIDPSQEWNRLEIQSTPDTPGMWYVIRAPGRIIPGRGTEVRDGVVAHGGVWEAQGTVGPTGSDEYFINATGVASIQAFRIASSLEPTSSPTSDPVPASDYDVVWNGSVTSVDAITVDGSNGNGGNGSNGNGGNGSNGNGGNGSNGNGGNGSNGNGGETTPPPPEDGLVNRRNIMLAGLALLAIRTFT